jgi:hypothetical protein
VDKNSEEDAAAAAATKKKNRDRGSGGGKKGTEITKSTAECIKAANFAERLKKEQERDMQKNFRIKRHSDPYKKRHVKQRLVIFIV